MQVNLGERVFGGGVGNVLRNTSPAGEIFCNTRPDDRREEIKMFRVAVQR